VCKGGSSRYCSGRGSVRDTSRDGERFAALYELDQLRQAKQGKRGYALPFTGSFECVRGGGWVSRTALEGRTETFLESKGENKYFENRIQEKKCSWGKTDSDGFP